MKHKEIYKIIIIIIFMFFVFLLKPFININKTWEEEYEDIQKYISKTIKDSKIEKNRFFYKSPNPKISIVITVYNGEGYLKTSLTSIQNQNFKDVEIILIDDGSKDNSVELIKKLMENDKRIILYRNKINKGMLYTKTKGASLAKAKYVMILDVDDMYIQKDVFTTLYSEAEKNNLDIISFGGIVSPPKINKKNIEIFNYHLTEIIFQPQLSNIMYIRNHNNEIKRGEHGYCAFYFIKTEILKNAIINIGDEFLNRKINFHDDLIIFFSLIKIAHNFRHIKRLFYLVVRWEEGNNKKMIFRLSEKNKNRKYFKCFAFINYIKYIFIRTNNNTQDKKIASFSLKTLYLNHECKNNRKIRNLGINLCKLFLENQYIDKGIKNDIISFLNSTIKINRKI